MPNASEDRRDPEQTAEPPEAPEAPATPEAGRPGRLVAPSRLVLLLLAVTWIAMSYAIYSLIAAMRL